MKCSNCGTEIRKGSLFCHNCGARIENQGMDSGMQNEKQPTNSRKRKWMAAVLVILSISAIIGIVLWKSGRPEEKQPEENQYAAEERVQPEAASKADVAQEEPAESDALEPNVIDFCCEELGGYTYRIPQIELGDDSENQINQMINTIRAKIIHNCAGRSSRTGRVGSQYPCVGD